MVRNLSLSIFVMALTTGAYAATNVLPNTTQLNEAQFGSEGKKTFYEVSFKDGKKVNISSCGDYLQAKKSHGEAVELSSSPQDFNSLVANLPLCELNEYIQSNNLKVQPSSVILDEKTLPAQFYWAINKGEVRKLKKAKSSESLKKLEPKIKPVGNNKYLADTKAYEFSSYGKLNDGNEIIELSNHLTSGALKNTRYYIITPQQKSVKIIKEFSILN
jgi:hypothetical protein